MVRMGSPVRFRRGAPPQTSSSGRVQRPTCRAAKSRGPRLPESLPVRMVCSGPECLACRGHSRESPAPVDLTLEVVTAAVAGGRVHRGGSADPVRVVTGGLVAVAEPSFLRQRMTHAGRGRAPGQATAALCSEAALLGGLGGSSWQADQNVQPDSLLEQMLEPWTVD